MADELIDTFEIKSTLDSRLYSNVETDDFSKIRIQSDIRKHLLFIARDFLDFTKLPEDELEIHDIVLTGSLANFNWSIYSDIDLHIIINTNKINDDVSLSEEFLQAKKNVYNRKHNVSIKGHPVEVYPQSLEENHNAKGQYSLLKDNWRSVPSREYFEIDKSAVLKKAEEYISQINEIEMEYKDGTTPPSELIQQIRELKEKINNLRKSGLDKGGESSNENIAFKFLRRGGYIDRISNLKLHLQDEMLTID